MGAPGKMGPENLTLAVNWRPESCLARPVQTIMLQAGSPRTWWGWTMGRSSGAAKSDVMQDAFLALWRGADALLAEQFGHAFAVIDVHLAAEALDPIGPGGRGAAHGQGPIGQLAPVLKRYPASSRRIASRDAWAIALRLAS